MSTETVSTTTRRKCFQTSKVLRHPFQGQYTKGVPPEGYSHQAMTRQPTTSSSAETLFSIPSCRSPTISRPSTTTNPAKRTQEQESGSGGTTQCRQRTTGTSITPNSGGKLAHQPKSRYGTRIPHRAWCRSPSLHQRKSSSTTVQLETEQTESRK